MKPTTHTQLPFAAPALKKALSFLSGGIISNPLVPALENVKIHVANQTATMTTSDMYTTLTCSMPIDSSVELTLLMPYQLLTSLVSSMGTDVVVIGSDLESFGHTITSKASKYRLSGENPLDYPNRNREAGTNPVSFTLNPDAATNLLCALQSTLYATGTDALRVAMTGVNVSIGQDNLLFAATNGHILTKYTLEVPVGTPMPVNTTMPGRFVKLLSRLLSEKNPSSDLTLTINSQVIMASLGTYSIQAVLIDDRFPDYQNAIPVGNPILATVERMELMGILRRVLLVANKTTFQVRLSLSSGTLSVSAEDMDYAHEGTESMLADYDQDPFEIGFNGKYLMECLTHIDGDRVQFAMSAHNKAALLFGADKNSLTLLMPALLNTYA